MPKSLAPTQLHAPLLPLYKWSLNDAHLAPGVLVWNQHRTQDLLQTCNDGHDLNEPPRISNHSANAACTKQHGNMTRIRSRFRISLMRQHYYDLNILPATTISLTGDFCLETRSSPCQSPERSGPVLSRCNIPTFMDTQAFCLAVYLLFNLSLTLYNKMVLGHFPFPYTLTALHAFCGAVGGHLLLKGGVFASTHLDLGQNITLLAFSILYAVNIIVSNFSLQLVTIPVSLCYFCVYTSEFLRAGCYLFSFIK